MSMVVTDAMIVAGGRGTRLFPLTHDTPKPLLKFCGRPFLEGVIGRLADAGVDRIFLVVGADTSPFEILRPAAAELGVTLVMVPEPEALDTAGGVRAAAEQVEGPFLVLNGDVLTDVDVREVLARHLATQADATLTLALVEDTSTFGVCVRDDLGMVTRFVEKPAPGTLPGQNAINAGTYVLEAGVIRAFPPGRLSFEHTVFPGILESGGAIAGFVSEGVWGDIGTPQRWLWGHAVAMAGDLSWPCVAAVPERAPRVRVHPDAQVDVRATLVEPVLVAAGARIRRGAVVGPGTYVGRSALIGEGVHLLESVIGDACDVGAGVRVARLITGDDVRIGERARLGPDIVLGDSVEVAPGQVIAEGARLPEARP